MQVLEIDAVVDGQDELRIKLPPGYRYSRARVAVTLPDRPPDRETAMADSGATTGTTAVKPLQMGLFRGRIRMAGDFNEPLPDDFWTAGNP